MSLADVAHQGRAQRFLQTALGRDRLGHAYLFHGPDGVGKEKLALGFAELLLCPQSTEEELDDSRAKRAGIQRLRMGCGTCDDCRTVAARTHPDLHIVYRQLNRHHLDPVVRKRKALDIGVDVLRQFVIEPVGRTPLRGRTKVFIIREADRITPQAQNALLKTLEEPPGATVIILLVSALDRLLPTTLSRCQVVAFDALPAEFVRAELASMRSDLAPEQIEWYARCSDGSLGRAVARADDNLFALNQRVMEALSGLVAAERSVAAADSAPSSPGVTTKTWIEESKKLGDLYRKRDPDITDTEASRRGLKSIFLLAANWYADVLHVGSGDEAPLVNVAGAGSLQKAAGALSPSAAIEAVNRIAEAEHHLDQSANTQLCVETLVNDLARLSRGETVSVP